MDSNYFVIAAAADDKFDTRAVIFAEFTNRRTGEVATRSKPFNNQWLGCGDTLTLSYVVNVKFVPAAQPAPIKPTFSAHLRKLLKALFYDGTALEAYHNRNK